MPVNATIAGGRLVDIATTCAAKSKP